MHCLIFSVLLMNNSEDIVKLKCGGIAQLGEHLPCKQGVRSSNLLISTTYWRLDTGYWMENINMVSGIWNLVISKYLENCIMY